MLKEIMACVPVMNEQERPKLNGNSTRNHSVYKCNHIFYCAAVASCYTQPITINQELTFLLLPWIIWDGTTLFPSPRKPQIDQSINAAWSTWLHLTAVGYLSKLKNVLIDKYKYSESTVCLQIYFKVEGIGPVQLWKLRTDITSKRGPP